MKNDLYKERPQTEAEGAKMDKNSVREPYDKDNEKSSDKQVKKAFEKIEREEDDVQKLLGHLDDIEIRITDEIDEDEPLLMLGGRTILSRGNIGCVIGKAKSKKSFLMTAIAASIGGECLGFTMNENAKSVVYIDTEQSKSHVYKVLKRIHRLNGWPMTELRDEVHIYAGRELPPYLRQSLMTIAALLNKADLIIIDGIRDLVDDFNDVTESSAIVNWLMKRSSEMNCGILTVLHMNKADNNARGHLGTELMNKSEMVLSVESSKDVATVKPVFCRNLEPDEFSFRINVHGLPELCDSPSITEKIAEHNEILKSVFGSLKRLDRKVLIRRLIEYTSKSQRTCERLIKSGLDEGLLKPSPEGCLCYQSLSDDDYALPF